MTSKSPEPRLSGDESVAPAGKGGAGDSGQAATLSRLRSAISEIDQRHAEGESGFFAGLSGLGGDDAGIDNRTGGVGTADDDQAGRNAKSKTERSAKSHAGKSTSKGTKSKSRARKAQPKNEPANGWVEGDATDLPDFVSAEDDFGDAGHDFANTEDTGLGFDEEEDAPDFDADYGKAKKTAMNMLAMRDHSREELRKKLLKRELMPEAVETLLDKLENSRLLNDEEFAHRFVRAQRENRKLSKSVLKRELSKKGISPELASDAVAEVDGEEDLAREVAAKKAASTRRLDYTVRERRILGMLARRGFPSAISIKVTKEVLSDD